MKEGTCREADVCEQERERPTRSREKSGQSPQAKVRTLKHAVSSTHETNKRNARRGQTPNVPKHSHTHDTSRGHAPAVSQAPQGQAHHDDVEYLAHALLVCGGIYKVEPHWCQLTARGTPPRAAGNGVSSFRLAI